VREFSLGAYRRILLAARNAGYSFSTVAALDAPNSGIDTRVLTIRHDVDRRPENALAMAELEAALGIRATYYFRIVPTSFKPEIILKIAALQHEVGYHYEDFFLAKYDHNQAMRLFAKHLTLFRSRTPVRTISMHGSPLAKHSNLSIWRNKEYESFGVRDCTLSFDWTRHAYFTDTGRTFGQTTANLRDAVDGMTFAHVRSNADLQEFLRDCIHSHVLLNVHPERWDDKPWPWAIQALRDSAVNIAKRVIAVLRRLTK
jgi:hypothetical protein